jgi:hypothetical protein
MAFVNTSFSNPLIDDLQLLTRLPEEIANALRNQNGFIVEGGGFHMRGACLSPLWHSLRAAWEGEFALNRLYPSVSETDIPFGEDCFGDQYLLRDKRVARLIGETGEIEDTGTNCAEFLAHIEAEPIEFLQLQHLCRFQQEGGILKPGYLLSVYPPFIAEECVNPSLRPIPALELRSCLADFASQIKEVQDGQKIRIEIAPCRK